ncbi:hypothetical protein ABIB82_005712 [Bradyrhizobium sp. i1.8.4]|uniref:hypothetical protein n=1 Tax=unclassified Bradyrhizobium TaxID=2631580 RepID=UPI003D22463C
MHPLRNDFGSIAAIAAILRQSPKAEVIQLARHMPWSEQPADQTLPFCKDAENKARKYTIENSPGWNRPFRKKLQSPTQNAANRI